MKQMHEAADLVIPKMTFCVDCVRLSIVFTI